MLTELLYSLHETFLVSVLLALLLIATELGFRLARRKQSTLDEAAKSAAGSIEAGVLAFMGLLLAFTYAIASERYEIRRQLVVKEANAIGSTYLRAQMLPEPHRTEVVSLLRQYADARLDLYGTRIDSKTQQQVIHRTERLQEQLWSHAVGASEKQPNPITALFVASLNDVIDLHTKRLAAIENRVPGVVLFLVLAVAIAGAGMTGYGSGLGKRRNFLLTTMFCLLIALLMVVILDFDRPRQGLIRVSQESMITLRDSIKRDVPPDKGPR